jgi:hypothetical protein
VEWNIGEAAGMIAAQAVATKAVPRRIRGDEKLLKDFQARLDAQGIERAWPRIRPV